jgi:hypothetical protein
MISPVSLTTGQRQFLWQRFRVDVDRSRPHSRYPRVHIAGLFILPFLVTGLLFLDAPEAQSLVQRPTELILWSFAIFGLIAEPVVFAWLWYGTRKHPGEDSKPSYEWRLLFRDRIRERRRWPLQWPLRICSLMMLVAAVMTGRPALAAALVGALGLHVLRHAWQDRAVARALDGIEKGCIAGRVI